MGESLIDSRTTSDSQEGGGETDTGEHGGGLGEARARPCATMNLLIFRPPPLLPPLIPCTALLPPPLARAHTHAVALPPASPPPLPPSLRGPLGADARKAGGGPSGLPCADRRRRWRWLAPSAANTGPASAAVRYSRLAGGPRVQAARYCRRVRPMWPAAIGRRPPVGGRFGPRNDEGMCRSPPLPATRPCPRGTGSGMYWNSEYVLT